MRYTVRDTPGLVARIEGDLDTITRRVREADPRLRALVLTGGFARGEGTTIAGVPRNDYDLVAIRGLGRARVPYARTAETLGRELGLTVDLAPVAALRLPLVASSLFWYETAHQGRTLWGDELLERIRVRRPDQLDRREGMRLVVNRAAGLLFATREEDPDAVRMQAAKGLLAASDAWLLSRGRFAPSQGARQVLTRELDERLGAQPERARSLAWIDWAHAWKHDPDTAPHREPRAAWRGAAEALLDAVPAALATAGHRSLAAYGRRDDLIEAGFYALRTARATGLPRVNLHATGRVRVATLRLLAASLDGTVPRTGASKWLGGLAHAEPDPLRSLANLRALTLQ